MLPVGATHVLRQRTKTKRHVAGASQGHAGRADRAGADTVGSANSRCLSLAEGRRGVQDANCASHGVRSLFINFTFH
jgi:hypothetical protein